MGKGKSKEKAVQFTFRWHLALDSLLKGARNHQRNSRPIKKIVAQALRRCLPFAKDKRPDREIGRESRNVEIDRSLHARLQRVARLPGRLDDPNNASWVLIEALCRYFYFRAKHFSFSEEALEATGYGKETEPDQPHHDKVKEVEELLDYAKYGDIAEAIAALLDSDHDESPNSLNQLMTLANEHRKPESDSAESWLEAMKIWMDKFEERVTSEFSREFRNNAMKKKARKRRRGGRR